MASEMQALVCDQAGSLRRVERPIPRPGAGEALVRMRALGICGSDNHAFRGKQPMFTYPRVMGHEIAGEIVELGSGVRGLEVGQQVVAIPYRHCGVCVACRRGRTTCCTNLSVMGVHRDGAMQEYVAVEADDLVPVTAIGASDAALVEPYSISAHAVSRAGLRPGDWTLVAGAGPIGLGAAEIARGLGAQVIVADTSPARLSSAQRIFGFSVGLDARSSAFEGDLLDATGGDGPVVIIDATGNADSMNAQAGRIAAGGTIVFVGLHSGDVQFKDLVFHKKEATLHASRAATREDFETVIALAAEGKIRPGQMRSVEVAFSELDAKRFAALSAPEIIKSVVVFGE